MARPHHEERFDNPRAPDLAEAPPPLEEDVRPPTKQHNE